MAQVKRVCNDQCPVCCEETIEEYNARVEAGLRNRSLTLANVMVVSVFIAQCVFGFYGKSFAVPEWLYAVLMAPYGGAALSKISTYINKVADKNGNGGKK